MAHSQVQQLRELRVYVFCLCKLIIVPVHVAVPLVCSVRCCEGKERRWTAAARADDDDGVEGPVLSGGERNFEGS